MPDKKHAQFWFWVNFPFNFYFQFKNNTNWAINMYWQKSIGPCISIPEWGGGKSWYWDVPQK